MSNGQNDSANSPKRIAPDQVEVIAADGHTIQEAKDHAPRSDGIFGNGQIRVIKGGPAMLLLLPVLIPLLLVAFFFLMILAIFFGKTIFKTVFARTARFR